MMGRYLTVSTAVMDEVHPYGSEAVHLDPGGAGLYAYAGMRVWTDSVSLCAGKGKDFDLSLENWFDRNKVGTSCMFNVDDYTPRTIVRYQEDGERTETPKYGAEHYQRFVADAAMIESHIDGVEGVYIFKEANQDLGYWKSLLELRRKHGFTLMWEISADTTVPKNLDFIRSVAPEVDIFSINRTETMHLFSCSEDECIENLGKLGFPLVFYRRGKDGSVLIAGKETVIGKPVDAWGVVDPTGAGNSSTGAVLVGRTEGRSLKEIAAMSSISSAFIISCKGVPEITGSDIETRAEVLLHDIMGDRA